jgi:hypothetical protein
MPTVNSLTGDELKSNKNLIRAWLSDEVIPLAITVAERTASDAGNHVHIPSMVKDLRDENVDNVINDDLIAEFEETSQLRCKERPVALRMLQTAVNDLALFCHISSTVEKITEDNRFYPSAAANVGLDTFMDTKYKELIKWTTMFLLKFLVENMLVESSDNEDSEDSDDSDEDDSDEEDEEDEEKAGVEKDSGDSDSDEEEEEDGEEEGGSESGEPDSDAERKMVEEAGSESEDDESGVTKKRKREDGAAAEA